VQTSVVMVRHTSRILALCFCWLLAAPADARKQHELAYRYEQIWNAALRLVKVDLRLAITDRDQDGGYVLFDYVAHGKNYPGSVELVKQSRGARPMTTVIVQVQGQPTYVEQMILDRLEKKLQAEVGAPPEEPKPPPPPPDAGSEVPAPPAEPKPS